MRRTWTFLVLILGLTVVTALPAIAQFRPRRIPPPDRPMRRPAETPPQRPEAPKKPPIELPVNDGRVPMHTGWKEWSPREEIAPRFRAEQSGGHGGTAALSISGGGNPAAFGGWFRTVEEIQAGRDYEFQAWYRTDNVPYERRSVSARLIWLDEGGRQTRPPDYVLETGRDGDWVQMSHVVPPPERTVRVRIELLFGWAPKGTVKWSDVRLAPATNPRKRVARVMTVHLRPSGSSSASESVNRFCELVEQSVEKAPDIVCLPEGISVVGTGKSYADVAEPVPGPTTARLGKLAQTIGAWVVAGLYERDGAVIYNTAVLIDRRGNLAGRYRKTHLPREEVDGGITPGDEYPVFNTDFGRVGLLICWDVQFPEPARALALQGAELILLPIWGGSEVLTRARAIENHLFVVTSGYDMKSFVVDPTGEILGEATTQKPLAIVETPLDAHYFQPWLGDMKARTWRERRPDLPVEPRKTK